MIKEFLIRLGNFLAVMRSVRAAKINLIILFSVVIVLLTYFLSAPHLQESIEYKIGDIAREDIVVAQNFRYIDEGEKQRLQKQAYDKERMVFDRDVQIFTKFEETLQLEIGLILQAIREKPSLVDMKKWLPGYFELEPNFDKIINAGSDRFQDKLGGFSIDFNIFFFTSFAVLHEKLNKSQEDALAANLAVVRSINDVAKAARLAEENVVSSGQFLVANQTLSRPELERTFDLVSQHSLAEKFSFGKMDSLQKIVIKRILSFYLQNPYVRFNSSETHFRKDMAAKTVSFPYKEIKKGTILSRRGEVIREDKFEKINIININLVAVNLKTLCGIFLIQIILALGISFYLFRFSSSSFRNISSFFILISLVFFLFVVAFFFANAEIFRKSPVYFAQFLPLGFIALMLAFHFGARITMSLGIYISINIFFIADNSFPSFLISFCTFLAGILISEKITRRTKLLISGIYLSAYSLAVVIGYDLISNVPLQITLIKAGVTIFNSLFSALLVIALLPVYELIFNLPTPFRLLELSDTNHPVLTEMATTAPSTWAHSLMVANLSERAVAAIGGDVLLTRVGCLFHDIGKMENPSFFAENKHLFPTSDQFKKLGPLRSAQIIINHVIEGIVKARRIRLPEKVIAFIPEHHGTTTIQYFYHKELELAEKKQKGNKKKKIVDKKQFSYLGPKPQSKETAVVMIADSLEAAVRSLQSGEREKIIALIDVIVENKMSEKQFSDCPLTLGELEKIKLAFLDVLISSYHSRPQYPAMKETRRLEENQEPKISVEELAQGKSKKIIL